MANFLCHRLLFFIALSRQLAALLKNCFRILVEIRSGGIFGQLIENFISDLRVFNKIRIWKEKPAFWEDLNEYEKRLIYMEKWFFTLHSTFMHLNNNFLKKFRKKIVQFWELGFFLLRTSQKSISLKSKFAVFVSNYTFYMVIKFTRVLVSKKSHKSLTIARFFFC